jgi:hypothetical protein
MSRNLLRGLTLVLAAALSPGCGGDDSVGPQAGATATITVDDATATQYLKFTDDAANVVMVAEADAATSTAWDLSFFTTTVASNSTANVAVYCLCGNEAATGDAVMAMTADGQLSTFENVTASDIPAGSSFATDAFATHKWYRYNITGSDNQIWPVYNVYLVERGTAVYKIQIVNYYNTAGEPRHVTVRYARLRD